MVSLDTYDHIVSLHGYYSNRRFFVKNVSEFKSKWRAKSKDECTKCHVIFTSIHSSRSKDWYFDSGYSRHMTNNSSFFSTNFKECNSGYATFGDGVKGKVLGKENISKPGLPCLQDARLVKSLSANLINISQLFDLRFFYQL